MNDIGRNARHRGMLDTALGSVILNLMADPTVIEIMLNPDGRIWVERLGFGKNPTEHTLSIEHAANIIRLVASCRDDVSDARNPEVAAEMPESRARFQGWLPPVVRQPCFSIRKKGQATLSLDDFILTGAATSQQVAILRDAVRKKRNIVIAGGTSSGKTTLANALLRELRDTTDRVFILEDLPELHLEVEDVVTMQTCEHVSMQRLVRGSLRMRPDRIVIGEVRDGAALELLKAWNTGHRGGLCTVHANSPRGTLARLEDLVQEMVPVVPQRLLLEAIDLIVFMERDDQGNRRVIDIAVLEGIREGEYQLRAVATCCDLVAAR